MPHLTLEFSANLRDRLDIDRLVAEAHALAMSTGAFAPTALRTRAIAAEHSRVADGHPDNAFLHIVLRMRPGRSPALKQQIGTTIFEGLQHHLAPVFATTPIGLTFEMQEIDTANRFLADNLEEHLARRSLPAAVETTGAVTIRPIPFVKLLGRGEKAKFTHLVDFGQDVEFGYFAWYLEDDGKKILVDAGGTAEMALGFGRPPETVQHIQTLAEGLARFGVTPAEIDIVILTHLHLDHIAYVQDVRHARFIVQADEVAFARNPHPTDRFYDFSALDGLELEVVRGDVQVTPHVRLILTPGHTVGGQSVVAETEAGTAVITGFCCIHDNFDRAATLRGKPEVIVPGIHHDVIAAYDSMVRVKAVADIIIANHDARYVDIDRIP